VTTENSQNNPAQRRAIKSFVLRQGRLTNAQQNALENHWQDYGIDFSEQPLDYHALFGNDNEIIVEIGFGDGDSLLQQAINQPQYNFIGIEVHGPGVGLLLRTIDDFNCSNVRIFQHDAIEVLQNMIPDKGLDCVQLFFPDPWHKKRHHKRRIVQRSFLENISSKLKVGGTFHAATDWQHYAEHILKILRASEDLFENTSTSGDYIPRPEHRPLTKFEQRGHRLGHGVWDLIFKRR